MTRVRDKINSVLPLATDFYIEIFDKKEVVLTGDVEVTELENSVLKIKSNEHGISFYGKNLLISCYDSGGLKINGELEKIEFC